MLDTHVSKCLSDAIILINATNFGISKPFPRMMNLEHDSQTLVREAGSTASGRGCRLFVENQHPLSVILDKAGNLIHLKIYVYYLWSHCRRLSFKVSV